MAGWEDELSALLNDLGVKQEEPQTRLRQRKPMRSDVKRRDQFADALLWNDDSDVDDDDPWMKDLDVMRHEVDTIVSQVVLLMQRGDLDVTLKEDVMMVLRALRRRVPNALQTANNDEVYLESASALLHFCRLVLQLSEIATEDF